MSPDLRLPGSGRATMLPKPMDRFDSTHAPRRWRRPSRPFVARGDPAVWADLQNITVEWLADQLQRRQVPVFSRSVVDDQTRQAVCTMAQLAEHLEDAQRNSQRWYLVEDFVVARKLKLRQRLQPYVQPFLPRPTVVGHAALWVGPVRSRTGLHADPDGVNILVMVRGQKRFLLIPPQDTPYLYRSTQYDGGAWASDVDVFDRHALRTWPLYKRARRQTVVLEPGDMLYVPRHWWHAVENLDTTVALSYRAETPVTAALNAAMPVKFVLHHLGLFQRGNCTCHPARVAPP